MAVARRVDESRGSGLPGASWAACAIVGLASAFLLLVLVRHLVGHQPTYDELLHVLAARGMAATGAPAIADGLYDRAQLYTWLVSLANGLGLDELVAARLPALTGAILLVAAVAAWTARMGGRVAGMAAGALLVTNLWTIDLAVFARFYTLHALAVFGVFAAVHAAVSSWPRKPATVAWLVLSLPMLAVAMHLQITSVISIGAVLLGAAAGWVAENRVVAGDWMRRHRWALGVGLVVGLVAGAFVFQRLGFIALFRETPLWAAGASGWVNYYNKALSSDMPLFWPLVPVASLVVCVARPRLGWTLLVAAAVAIAVHSLAASKAERYVYYAIPLLCALLGLAAGEVARWGLAWADGRGGAWRRTAPLWMAGLAGMTIAASQEGYRAARLIVGADSDASVLGYGDEPDWSAARPILRDQAARAGVVIVSNAMKALYYLGRYDYELNVSIVAETNTRAEFGIDGRTGRRAISSPQSLARVLDDHADALVVAEREKLGSDSGVTTESLALVERRCEPVPLPAEVAVNAWWCGRASR